MPGPDEMRQGRAMPTEETSSAQKTVLLGITGCIAAYKACEVLRGLQKAGVRVKVVMTHNATRFVGPTTFRSLTHEPVAVSLFDEAGDPIHHISLAAEADLFLICPATANVCEKVARGQADDLLTTTALACTAPLLIAPAMNVHMWENARMQASLAMLREQGVRVIEPASGHLACGYDGKGKLAPVDEIVSATLEALEGAERAGGPASGDSDRGARASGDLAGRRVLVTAGPTHEPLDPVRFLGNRSSGKTGYAIAAEARARGAAVTLVSGPVSLDAPDGVEVVRVTTAEEMLSACRPAFDRADAAIFTAAVADFRPASRAAQKIKKDPDDPAQGLTLELVRNPDILATLAATKAARAGTPAYVVGFAAETQDVIENAQAKLARKGADLIVANDVSDPSLGFGSDANRVWLVSADGVSELPVLPKRAIASKVIDKVACALAGGAGS